MKPAVVTAHVKNQQAAEGRDRIHVQRACLRLGDVAECLLDAYESVTMRAHQNYVERGAVPGQDLENWIDAERELLGEVPIDFAESEKFVYALASVDEFAAAEISVAVEPGWLLILARAVEEETPESLAPRGEQPRQLFSMFELQVPVENAGAIAVLADGLLAIRIPKSRK